MNGEMPSTWQRSGMPAVRALSIAYIEIVRGIPLITFLFMAAVMFPLFMPQGVAIDKLLRETRRKSNVIASMAACDEGVQSPKLGVAVHPRDADTAWFVPADKDERRVPLEAKLVVARTRDGGKSFSVLRNGLPQEHAYDLVYRHGLAVDDAGERLAIGSTTGGLWVSEDQGERWRSIAARLPPIYALRFA